MKITNRCSVDNGDNSPNQRESEIIKGIFESKTRYRKVIQAGIAKWIKDFQEGRVKVETVDDLRKLIELDLELQNDDLLLNRWCIRSGIEINQEE